MQKSLYYKIILLFTVLGIFITELILAYVINYTNSLTTIQKAVIVSSSIMISITASIIFGYIFARGIVNPINILAKKVEKVLDDDDELIITRDLANYSSEVVKLVNAFKQLSSVVKYNVNEIQNQKIKFETILSHMTDGVIAYNLQGSLIHINPVALKFLKNLDASDFDIICSKLHINVNLEKVFYNKHAKLIERKVYIDGSYYDMFFAVLTDEDDKNIGVIVVIQDTTEQVNLDNLRKDFVANVSHELKTPLTSIRSYSETIIDSVEMEKDEIINFVKVISEESNRMSRLINDLLKLSTFDYKKVRWNKINLDLGKLVKSVCNKLKIEAEKRNQKLECYITAKIPPIFVDKDGIEQVLQNVIMNAIKYTPDQGSISIYVGFAYTEAYVKIIDNGIGIPESDLPRIFERFYRVDKARSKESGGTGLGLSIAKEIVEGNDGTIDITSTEGKGTEVLIKLPK